MEKKNKRRLAVKKGQLELWILTKIAMLFFIISLFFIALNISNLEKSALCGEQALATANIIASNVNQVLASPVEDSRVVYKFEPTIPISKDKFGERYEVWIAEHQTANPNKKQLSIVVNPLGDASCRRMVTLFYDPEKVETHFYSNAVEVSPDETISRGESIVKLQPSLRDALQRTKFLVIVKCRDKLPPRKSFIYFDDCKNSEASACSAFEPPAYEVCGT
ncbi:MAG: hypothetical protein Q8R15_05265 [Candidatus Micrarchaeota archaeon]|nr:hypothetical protein [Candidatus Micrarchaeota archaeon]